MSGKMELKWVTSDGLRFSNSYVYHRWRVKRWHSLIVYKYRWMEKYRIQFIDMSEKREYWFDCTDFDTAKRLKEFIESYYVAKRRRLRKFSLYQIIFIGKLCLKLSYAQASKALKVSQFAVRNWCIKLGVRRKVVRRGGRWSSKLVSGGWLKDLRVAHV